MRGFVFLTLPLVCFAQGLWESRADYPIAATEVSSAALSGKVYSMCGLTPGGSVRSLYIYDPKYDAWTQGADIPIAGGADHCNVAAASGKIYLLGAIRIGSAFVDGNTYEYDPATNSWQMAGRMNTPRGASGVAAIGAGIYVAGGLNPGTSVADLDVFDTVSRRWTRLPAMPTARDHLTAQAIDGKVYAIAGRTDRDLTANEEYDPTTNQWRSRAPIPTARGGLASGTIDNRIQVFGGEGNSGTPASTFQRNEEYDPATDTWRTLSSMPHPRHGFYGATLDGRVFTPSGGAIAGANYSQVHDSFFLPPSVAPRIAGMGIRNAASLQGAIAPGSLLSVFGDRFSRAEQVASRFPLPLQMNGTAVKVNGEPVPLLYVAPGQVNFLLPFDIAPGAPAIQVTNAGSETTAAGIGVNDFRTDSAPGIFTISPGGQGAILIAGTGTIAGAAQDGKSRPARKGEIVEIYGTGLGAVSNPPRRGEAASAIVLSRTVGTTIVTIGTARAEVLFSGLAPGLAGVYQINARIPVGAPGGAAVPVTININEQGLAGNTATMAIAE